MTQPSLSSSCIVHSEIQESQRSFWGGGLWGYFRPQKMAQIIIFGAYLSVTSSFLLFSVYLFLKALLPMFNFLYLWFLWLCILNHPGYLSQSIRLQGRVMYSGLMVNEGWYKKKKNLRRLSIPNASSYEESGYCPWYKLSLSDPVIIVPVGTGECRIIKWVEWNCGSLSIVITR